MSHSSLSFEIRLFDLETHEATGANQYQDLRHLGGWIEVIERCRKDVCEQISKDRLLRAELIYLGELWKTKDGFGHQVLPVKIWEADVIDPKNPGLGYKEMIFIKLSDEEMEKLGFVAQKQKPVSQRTLGANPQALLSKKTG